MIILTFLEESSGGFVVITLAHNRIQSVGTVSGANTKYSTLEGLRWNIVGMVKEFPDLKGKPVQEIRKKGLKRFKEHLLNLKTENDCIDYLKKDLKKHGYKLIMKQRKGFRPEKVK